MEVVGRNFTELANTQALLLNIYYTTCISILISCILFYRYEKIKKGQTSGDDMEESVTTNIAAKYVILEETDEQDDGR